MAAGRTRTGTLDTHCSHAGPECGACNPRVAVPWLTWYSSMRTHHAMPVCLPCRRPRGAQTVRRPCGQNCNTPQTAGDLMRPLIAATIMIAACGACESSPSERVVSEFYSCGCDFVCSPATDEEHFQSVPYRLCAFANSATDAGPRMAIACREQLIYSKLCGSGEGVVVDPICTCGCTRIGVCVERER